MNATLLDFFHLVLAASWQSSLVILLILAVRPLMTSRIPARWRHLLWMLVLVRLLVPVSVLPPSPVSLQNLAVAAHPLEGIGLLPPSPAPLAPEIPPHPLPLLQGPGTSASTSGAATSAASSVTAPPSAPLPLPAASTSRAWSVAFAIWLTGALAALAIMTAAQITLWRRLGKDHRPIDPAIAEIWARCSRRLGVRRPPALRMSPGAGSPALVGLVRPFLLLPADSAATFSGEDWENIFVHELAHYRRADHWTHAVQLLALAVHWFNPLVWLGFRELRADRELAADEWALRHLAPECSSAYGHTLLKILAQAPHREPSLASVGILEDRDQLKRRLHRIAGFAPRTAAGSLLGVSLVLAVAVLALGRPEEKADLSAYGTLSPIETFVIAARDGDLPVVKEMLREGVDINAPAYIEANQKTALIAAAAAGQLKSVQLLLAKGADINRSEDEQTDGDFSGKASPIQAALKNGRSEVADYLLKQGAQCDPALLAAYTGDAAGVQAALAQTPADVLQWKLMAKIAASNGHADLFRQIVAKIKTQPRNSDWDLDDGSTVVAIARGHRDVVQAILDESPYRDKLNKNSVMRIGGAAAQTPGMRDWLISLGYDVPVYSPGEQLIDAAEREDIPEMGRLLKAGADVNYRGESSWTPITKTGAWDRPHALKFLLAHGADPNSIHIEGSFYTTLCLTSKPGMADMLLAAGAKIDGPPGGDAHIINYAISLDRTDMVKWYLDHGVDLSKAKPYQGEGGFLFEASNPEIAELLLKHGADVKAVSRDGGTALYEVCQRQDKAAAIARLLLEHGADPNARTKQGYTPLMVARDGATVDVLVKYGADLKAKTPDGSSLINFGGFQADASRLEALIRHGVPFDPKTDGPALLVKAAWTGQLDVITTLLDRGIDPNIEGCWSKPANDYMLPLEAAAISGQNDAVRLLLERGAKPNAKLVATAIGNRRAAMIKLFRDHGDQSLSPLSYAITQGAPVAELQKLLAQGGAPDPTRDTFYTPLGVAAIFGDLPAVKLLADHGADLENGGAVNSGNSRYTPTPLRLAAFNGQDEIVAYLLAHGAKPDLQAVSDAALNANPDPGNAPKVAFEKTVKMLIAAGALKGISGAESADLLLSSLFTRYPGGNQAVTRMLLDAGLRLDAKDAHGKTVMDQVHESARESNGEYPRPEILALLEKTAKAEKPLPAGK